jgi:hypothetical protein
MLVANNLIFDSTNAADGAWRDVSNWVAYSIHITGLEGNVWIEVSNDPAVKSNGASTLTAPTPVLSQYTPSADSHLTGVATNTTYYVKLTYVTKNGETQAGTEASLLVTAGNLLIVNPPVKDAGGLATSWNVYVSTASNKETLQNLTSGAVILPLQFGQPFNMINLLNAGPLVPGANTAGSIGVGINISGNLAAGSYTPPAPNFEETQIVIDQTSKQAMVNPSCLVWNYIRVRKDTTTQTLETKAFLFGQQG